MQTPEIVPRAVVPGTQPHPCLHSSTLGRCISSCGCRKKYHRPRGLKPRNCVLSWLCGQKSEIKVSAGPPKGSGEGALPPLPASGDPRRSLACGHHSSPCLCDNISDLLLLSLIRTPVIGLRATQVIQDDSISRSLTSARTLFSNRS